MQATVTKRHYNELVIILIIIFLIPLHIPMWLRKKEQLKMSILSPWVSVKQDSIEQG